MITLFFGNDEAMSRVSAVYASPGKKYFCPGCGAPLVLKQGEIKVWHFAHAANTTCDAFSENKMTPWHIRHQEEFPEDCREVRLEKDGRVRIADVKCGDLILEFQHSPISCADFEERSIFLSQFGRLVWVFDLRDKWMDQRIWWHQKKKPWDNDYGYFRWSHPSKMLGSYDYRNSAFDMFAELDDTGWGCLVEWNPDGMKVFGGRRFDGDEFKEYLRNVWRGNCGPGKLQPRQKEHDGIYIAPNNSLM